MKAHEVRRLLNISVSTRYRYHKQGKIRVEELPNGHYYYNDTDVSRLMRVGVQRKTYLYARVSTYKQKADLGNQIDTLQQWAIKNGYPIHGIYKDSASGISFEKCKDVFKLREEVLNYRVKTVIIT